MKSFHWPIFEETDVCLTMPFLLGFNYSRCRQQALSFLRAQSLFGLRSMALQQYGFDEVFFLLIVRYALQMELGLRRRRGQLTRWNLSISRSLLSRSLDPSMFRCENRSNVVGNLSLPRRPTRQSRKKRISRRVPL
jgi:hypothetical protein